MDEKSSPRSNRKLAIAVIALAAICLMTFLAWRSLSSPSETPAGLEAGSVDLPQGQRGFRMAS